MVAFLAIDSGSQSTKVSVVDATGTVHASAAAPLRPYELGPGGRAVHPDDDLWDALTVAAREALASYDGSAGDVVAVGLCGIRFCRALLDADGRLTEPVLSWMDARVAAPVEPVDGVATVTSAGGYLATRLTGERRDSVASHQGVLPPAGAGCPSWSTPARLLGHVTAAASTATGIPAGLPVHATANDKAVEALGCGLVEPGTVLLSLGTYVTAMTVADPPDAPGGPSLVGQRRRRARPHPRRERGHPARHVDGVVAAAAGERRGARPGRPARRRGVAGGRGPRRAAGVRRAADRPRLAGAPATRPTGAASSLGLDGSHGPHHLHRSVLEGIAMTMRRPRRGDGVRARAGSRPAGRLRRRRPLGPDDPARGRRLRPDRRGGRPSPTPPASAPRSAPPSATAPTRRSRPPSRR